MYDEIVKRKGGGGRRKTVGLIHIYLFTNDVVTSTLPRLLVVALEIQVHENSRASKCIEATVVFRYRRANHVGFTDG